MIVDAHPDAFISDKADIEHSPRGTRLVVGARSVIDSFVKIKPAGGAGEVVIGADCNINSGCVIYTGNGVMIGDGVAVAAGCIFAPTNHAFGKRGQTIREQRFLPSRGGITIEDDVWIGAGCVILDGAHIRQGAVIGAMSLVRGEVEAYSINAGNPLVKRGERE